MFLIGLGALLVLCGVLYMIRTAIWRGPLSGRDFLPTGSRHSGAANAQHAFLGCRYELAGHSPYGNRCSSVAVGGQFLTSVTRGLPL